MIKPECSVKNCLHNTDNCCCKIAIAADGNKAKTTEQTCRAGFDENKGGKLTNLFKTPETGLKVTCDAIKCVYSEEHHCSAERIDINGDGACECTEIRCSTFKAKQTQNQDGCVGDGDVLRGIGGRPRPFAGGRMETSLERSLQEKCETRADKHVQM